LSAFHFGTGLRNGLVHRAVARDAEDFLYVPGSTLKGALRDRCAQLARLFDMQVASPHTGAIAEANSDANIVARIFGTRFRPGHIYFDDAQLVEEDRELFRTDSRELQDRFRARQTEKRTQVSLSRLTRTARPGLLYSSEYGIRNLRFEGSIVGVLDGAPLYDLSPGTYPLLLLVAGLLSLDHLGGNRSAGAGRISCEISDQQVQVNQQPLSVAALLDELPYLEEEFYALWREEVGR
jgi:CRISPR/Cas system CSM-associated protein Csm3 (group 7 of RAMP superfamily)